MVKYAKFFIPFAEKAPSGRLGLQPLKAGIADCMLKIDLSGPIEDKSRAEFVAKWAGLLNIAFSKYRRTVVVPKVYETVAATLNVRELRILTEVLIRLDHSNECKLDLMPYPKTWETVETVDGIY